MEDTANHQNHLIGGFFVPFYIYHQGGIHYNNWINSDFLLDNQIIEEEQND